MEDDPQLEQPVTALLSAIEDVLPAWLRRCVVSPAIASGIDVVAIEPAIESMIATESTRLLGELRSLLSADVDAQRVNPLSLFRDAVAAPTAVLRSAGAVPVRRDPFAVEHFPDDVYGLAPSTWSDISPELHLPGITWGAWKAMTVMRRHRGVGLPVDPALPCQE